jgi:hypothetical protein
VQVSVLEGARLLKKETVKLTPMNPLSTIVMEVRTSNRKPRRVSLSFATRLRRKRGPAAVAKGVPVPLTMRSWTAVHSSPRSRARGTTPRRIA